MQSIKTEQVKKKCCRNNTKYPVIKIPDNLADISEKIEKAWIVCSDVGLDYFGYSKEYYQKHSYFLMEYYDKTRIFVNVVIDYLYDAKIMLDRLLECIDEIPEVSKENNRRLEA